MIESTDEHRRLAREQYLGEDPGDHTDHEIIDAAAWGIATGEERKRPCVECEHLRQALRELLAEHDKLTGCCDWNVARKARRLIGDTGDVGACEDCAHYWERRSRCVAAVDDNSPGRPWLEPEHRPDWCPGFKPRNAEGAVDDE